MLLRIPACSFRFSLKQINAFTNRCSASSFFSVRLTSAGRGAGAAFAVFLLESFSILLLLFVSFCGFLVCRQGYGRCYRRMVMKIDPGIIRLCFSVTGRRADLP